MIFSEPAISAVVFPASKRETCNIIIAAARKLGRDAEMYNPARAKIYYEQSFHSFRSISPETESYFTRELGDFAGVREAGSVKADVATLNCKFGRSRTAVATGINMTFHRPVLSASRRSAALIVEADYGVREGLPGVFSLQRLPPMLCRLQKTGSSWSASKCENLPQGY